MVHAQGYQMSQPEVTFEEIEHLLVELSIDDVNKSVTCGFLCPLTGRIVRSQGDIRGTFSLAAILAGGLIATGKEVMKEYTFAAFKRRFRSRVFDTVAGFFGGGMLGNFMGNTVIDPLRDSDRVTPMDRDPASRQEVNKAIVRAFESVRGEFKKTDYGWVALQAESDLESDFLLRLSRQPVTRPHDREVASRLFHQLAALGGVRREEEEFLAKFTTGEFADEAPSKLQLSQVSSAAAESIISLCWALALVDGEAGADEEELIRSAARSFDLTGQTCEYLRKDAADFILKRASAAAETEEERRMVAELRERLG